MCRSLPSEQSWSAPAVCLPNICHSSVDSCMHARCLCNLPLRFHSHCLKCRTTCISKLQLGSPEDDNEAYHNSKYLVRVRVPPVVENLCLLCDVQSHCNGNADARKDEGAWKCRAIHTDQKMQTPCCLAIRDHFASLFLCVSAEGSTQALDYPERGTKRVAHNHMHGRTTVVVLQSYNKLTCDLSSGD